MKQELLIQFPSTWMTVFGLALFMSLFTGFAIYLYFVERKSSIEYKQNIPFHTDDWTETK